MFSRFIYFALAAVFLFSCSNKEMEEENKRLKKNVKQLKQTVQLIKNAGQSMNFLSEQMKDVKAKIVTNYGDIELKFFAEEAPIHCFNFITRAESGFYDNVQFHRVIPDFMIQAGDPNTKTNNKALYGSGGPLVAIPHEFNDISHKRGILSMARTADVTQGAGSQFFICHADVAQLDKQYTVFGEVTSGMETVDKIANVERGAQDLPLQAVRIKTIEVYR
jgi:cyclophilin family peptidyl-prolyl cis-trans isomerase